MTPLLLIVIEKGAAIKFLVVFFLSWSQDLKDKAMDSAKSAIVRLVVLISLGVNYKSNTLFLSLFLNFLTGLFFNCQEKVPYRILNSIGKDHEISNFCL